MKNARREPGFFHRSRNEKKVPGTVWPDAAVFRVTGDGVFLPQAQPYEVKEEYISTTGTSNW
jgi:hypothetical protein